ncbi:hypothetical protein EWH08_18735 [Sphingobium indicum]|uniref:Uncharacterized protein n=1 Tax=Sphingobium indicum TaxID=332055 RepID=A0A4Q4IWP9_9SPHN|nr:putative esterase [Sphingobium indicum]RYL97449.1 hypothetical protein EWH08_18735 [Sphingobium indicum]
MHRVPNDAAHCRVPDRIELDPQAPIILAYGVGVDSTALLSVENRLAHIRAVVSCGIEHLSGTIKFIRRIGSRFIIGV